MIFFDKNGTEIVEMDIIQFNHPKYKKIIRKGIVKKTKKGKLKMIVISNLGESIDLERIDTANNAIILERRKIC